MGIIFYSTAVLPWQPPVVDFDAQILISRFTVSMNVNQLSYGTDFETSSAVGRPGVYNSTHPRIVGTKLVPSVQNGRAKYQPRSNSNSPLRPASAPYRDNYDPQSRQYNPNAHLGRPTSARYDKQSSRPDRQSIAGKESDMCLHVPFEQPCRHGGPRTQLCKAVTKCPDDWVVHRNRICEKWYHHWLLSCVFFL